MKICPICRKKYVERSAISHVDNKTEICPDCGMRQAIDALRDHVQNSKEK